MEGVCFSGKAWPSQQEAQKPGNLQSTSKYQNSTFEVAILVISHVWSYTFAAESMVIRPFFLQIHSKSWSGFIHLVSYLDIETYLCYIYVISPIYIYIYPVYIYIWFYTFHPVAIAGLSKPGPKTVLPTPQSPIDIGGESFRGVYVLHIYTLLYIILYYIILYYIILCYTML